MHILFTTTAGLGHFHPLVPLARAAVRAGHEVTFACPKSLCSSIEASGFQALSIQENSGPDPERSAALQRVMLLPPRERERGAVMVADVFIGIDARRALPELVAVCPRWHPDVVVREEFELGGAIAAEYLGLPHAAIQVTYSSYWQYRTSFSATAGQRLDQLRAI